MFNPSEFFGCIPFAYMHHPPKDQVGAILEAYPYCDKNMWVSDLKRKLNKEKGIKLICGFCLVQLCQANGINLNNAEFLDLLKTN